MKTSKKINLVLPIAAIFIPTLVFAPKAISGGFGAEIFCTMRDGGNEHESSWEACLLYTSPSPRDRTRSRMPSSA